MIKEHRKTKDLFVNCLLTIISISLALLIIEAGVRIRQYVKYGTVAQYVGADKIEDLKSGLMIPRPGIKTKSSRINSLGFRSPELDNPKAPGNIRVAFLGSSTTFCAEASNEGSTWPSLVSSMLQKTCPQMKMDYVNASAPGYVVSNDLVNLEKRVKPLEPDIIIIYDGFNDMSISMKIIAVRQNKRYYKEGWLEKQSLAYSLIKKNLTILVDQQNAKSGKDRLVFDPKEISRGFRKELTDLIVAGKKTAPIVAVATLSYKMRREQPDEERLRNANTALYYMPYMSTSGLLDAYEEYNRVIREAAKETGVILIENELVIPGDDKHFRDSIHFTDQGSELMAQRVVDSLVASAEYNNFLNSRPQK